MIFTDNQWAGLKVHATLRKNSKKVDIGDKIHKCPKCEFRSNHKTSVNRHEKRTH